MKNPLVSVIVVNWNGKGYLDACLSSLKSQSFSDIEIVVVDNGSVDGSIEFIEKKYSDIRVIKNIKNYGFATGNNIGIRASKGKYIATLNNDAMAERDWIKNLISVAEKREDIAMFAPKILSYSNAGLIESSGMLVYPDAIAKCRGYLEKDGEKYNRMEKILLPSACAALYRKDILFTAGLFDDDYFAYCEDIDLGLRIRMLGFGCIYVPEAKVYHHYSATSRNNMPFKIYLIERNRLWTLIKIFPWANLILSPIYTLKRYLSYCCAVISHKDPPSQLYKKMSGFTIAFILLKICGSTSLNLIKLSKKRSQIMHNKKMNKKIIVKLLQYDK
ncbi:MAG: glycosyltransferase family 2 protein [Candidatus Omnitrophota bacterium]